MATIAFGIVFPVGAASLATIMDGKKKRERRILDMVYGDCLFADLVDNERPDFLVRQFKGAAFFGVEVTELYESETSARLQSISGYCNDLLDGRDFKHKNDRIELDVTKVDILKEDGSIHVKDFPPILFTIPVTGARRCGRYGNKHGGAIPAPYPTIDKPADVGGEGQVVSWSFTHHLR